MLFNSLEFLFVFLPIVFVIYFLLVKFNLIKFTNLWLLIASLYFYAYYKIDYFPIIITSLLFNYTCGYFISRQTNNKIKKLILVFTVLGNLALLSYYKYFSQIIDVLNNFSFVHFDTMKLLLPLGISFFTFQQIGYITDLYRGEAKHTNIIDYSLFVSFFPQLISGPICTYKELVPQLQDNSRKKINTDNINAGLFLITIGLFEKVILADNFNAFISNAVEYNVLNEFFTSWIWAFAIAFRGYFDFSGYCDMALGIGKLFNINLPINFDSPYKSIDISDFWRRWHITMGRFLKYNVYIPMGGSRRGELRTYWNLFFVFTITGLWHGATMPCILYGVINGFFVCINKLWKKTQIMMNKKLAIFITFMSLVFISPLIAIRDISHFVISVKTMLGINANFVPVHIQNFDFVFALPNLSLNALLFAASFIIVFCFKNANELAPEYVRANSPKLATLIALLFVYSAFSITQGSQFIYFNF